MDRPSCIGHYLEFLDEDNASYPGSSELLSIGSAVGKKLGLTRIGIHIETLLPGRRTSYPHAESDEEEFAFVLEGNPHVWLNGNIYPLKPGDFVAFPAGTGIAHTFLNNTSGPAKLLVGGEASKKTNRIIYPLNDEMNLVKKTREQLWENPPVHQLGSHNGKPDQINSHVWNIPQLETSRLILRPLEMKDAPHIFKYASNPNVAEMVTWHAHKSLEDTVDYIKFAHSMYLQGVIEPMGITFRNEPDVVIGAVGAFWNTKVHKVVELGACLDEPYWGQGIVKEALEKLIDFSWGWYPEMQRIQARCKKENTRSFKMIKKLGMEYEGELKKSFVSKGISWDMQMFSLTRK